MKRAMRNYAADIITQEIVGNCRSNSQHASWNSWVCSGCW